MSIDNLTVRKRLSIGFGTSLFFIVLVACLGIRGLHETNKKLRHIVDVSNTKIGLLNDMSESANAETRIIRTIALLHDGTEIDHQKARILGARGVYDIAMESVKKMAMDEIAMSSIEKIRTSGVIARSINDRFVEINEVSPEKAVNLLMTESIPLNVVWQAAIHEFSDFQKIQNHNDGEVAAADYDATNIAMGAFSLVSALVCIALATIISHSILKQLGGEPMYAVAVANRIALGDLATHIETKPGDKTSLLYAIKMMHDSLEKIVAEVRSGTETITVAAGQISSGNMDLSARTEHQASSLEETSASLEELTSTVKNNAENATRASRMAMDASKQAQQGGEVVSQVVNTMSSINESSKKIVDIIAVIDSIAFQSNILSLNAAVEAARAGEQGRGFSAVATEVRNLAQRSANAAKEIKGLISDSVGKVETGSRHVEEAGLTMREVVESVRRVSDIIAEIAQASREQTSGIEQINEAVSQMDEVTQQNAALVEEASAAAHLMRDQANALTDAVNVFTLRPLSR